MRRRSSERTPGSTIVRNGLPSEDDRVYRPPDDAGIDGGKWGSDGGCGQFIRRLLGPERARSKSRWAPGMGRPGRARSEIARSTTQELGRSGLLLGVLHRWHRCRSDAPRQAQRPSGSHALGLCDARGTARQDVDIRAERRSPSSRRVAGQSRRAVLPSRRAQHARPDPPSRSASDHGPDMSNTPQRIARRHASG